MEAQIESFIEYCHKVKGTSRNTELSYRRDLYQLAGFLRARYQMTRVEDLTAMALYGYIRFLEEKQRKAATISRNIASIRAFCHYLVREGVLMMDVSETLKAPRVEKKLPGVLSPEEVERLMDAVQGTSPKELRDKAMLELLYATGIRVSDDDDKIRLNQRKPSKYKGLSRFGPEKNLQRINKFMKERPIFYKNLIQMKENFRFYLRCFYCITKVVILQFNSENRTELARNG